MAEKPYKTLVYALPASSPFVTHPQPSQPGSEAIFAIHGSTAVARGLHKRRRTTRKSGPWIHERPDNQQPKSFSGDPSIGLALQGNATSTIEQQDSERDWQDIGMMEVDADMPVGLDVFEGCQNEVLHSTTTHSEYHIVAFLHNNIGLTCYAPSEITCKC